MADSRAKILIIEDEALVARELKSRLSNMGYEVVGVAYDSAGIEMARKTLPDLLLTDIHLKDGEDGIDVAQRVQRERDVPVVFLTAYSDDATVSRAKSVAPYGYIIKPVENRELQIAIEMALYKFNIENELRETQQLLQTALTCIGNC
jgi:DNA-binding response OmpR family regulator